MSMKGYITMIPILRKANSTDFELITDKFSKQLKREYPYD